MTVVGYVESAVTWAQIQVEGTGTERRCLACAHTGGREFSLWFVELCRIVSISAEGEFGIA